MKRSEIILWIMVAVALAANIWLPRHLRQKYSWDRDLSQRVAANLLRPDTLAIAKETGSPSSSGRGSSHEVAGSASPYRPYSAAASEAKREWTRPSSSGCPAETTVAPIGREELGLGPRKCLLCDRPARECMRARTHSIEELLENIQTLVNSYLNL